MPFHVGLDLGQSADYTALAVVQTVAKEYPNGGTRKYLHLRHLERYGLRTPYPEMADGVAGLVRPEARPRRGFRGPVPLRRAEGGRGPRALARPQGELLNFRRKIDLRTAHDSYEHWRESDHDDLVLATALACWSARRRRDVLRVWRKPPGF